MDIIFYKLKKAQKTWIEVFESLKKLKNINFIFLQRIYSLRGNEGAFRDILKKKLEPVSNKVAYKLWKREGYYNIFIV